METLLEGIVADSRPDTQREVLSSGTDLYAETLLNRLVPVPQTNCAVPLTAARPGCFYRIQFGKGGLLKTVGRAYGVSSQKERLRLAKKVNNHPYNRLFWVTGKWPFETGQISFNPRFTRNFEDQVAGFRTSGVPKAASGKGFAILWMPPLSSGQLPRLQGSCTVPNVTHYWRAAHRIAFDAWRRLEGIVRQKDAFWRQLEWDVGRGLSTEVAEKRWFGAYSQANLGRVHKRMRRIVNVFQSPRRFTIVCRFNKKGYATSSPGVRRLYLKGDWKSPPPKLQTLERIQTFIHEAAHIAGISSSRESKKYGSQASRCLALKSPRQAAWNPDNYGYYAMTQAVIGPYVPDPLNPTSDCPP